MIDLVRLRERDIIQRLETALGGLDLQARRQVDEGQTGDDLVAVDHRAALSSGELSALGLLDARIEAHQDLARHELRVRGGVGGCGHGGARSAGRGEQKGRGG